MSMASSSALVQKKHLNIVSFNQTTNQRSMKNLYTLALAVAVSASSVSAEKAMTLHTDLTPAGKARVVATPVLKSSKSAAVVAPAKAPAKAPAASIAGEYTITIGDYYFQSSSNTEEDYDLTITQQGEEVLLECDYFVVDVIGKYSASTGKLSFETDQLGQVQLQDGSKYYASFEPFYWSAATESIISSDFDVTVKEDGSFVFPADHGFSWPVYSDAAYTEKVGYLDIFDVISIVKGASDPNEGWTSVGDATLQDGWMLPCLGIDQTDPANWYTVELQQNDKDKNVYRLVDPYKGKSPIAQYNASTKTGYIQFDVTDPDNVLFEAVDAGVVISQIGITKFFAYNTLGWAVLYTGAPASTIISVYPTFSLTTFKDGVVFLPSTLDEDGGYTSDACFGDQTDTAGGYGWQDNSGISQNMESKIIFPSAGISDVTADAADGAVEYFNLQGVRVANPENGVYIRTQGGKATKVFVK